jgi:hypothetical protein
MEGGGGAESVSQLSDSIVGVREVFRVSIRLPMHIDFLQQLPDEEEEEEEERQRGDRERERDRETEIEI